MDSKLSRWCDGFIEAGWLTAIIATPLFFNIHSDRVFEPDKLALLRSIAVLMAAAWLVKFVDQSWWQQYKRLGWKQEDSLWRMPFVAIVTLLALVYLLSSLFSVTQSVSWAGSYQRLQGTYTTLSYIVIFLTTIGTIRSMAQVRRVVTAVIITSIPISFYGLLQHFNWDPLPWAGDVSIRIAGHMGNSIFIAAYLIMVVPLTLARIVAAFSNILNDEELATADVIRSSVYIFTLAIQLIAIYWSGSRGPWLGLGVGLFAFILIVFVSLRNASPDKGRFRLNEAGKGILFVVAGTAVAYLVFSLLLNFLARGNQFQSLAGGMSSFLAFVAAVGSVTVAMFVMVAAQRGWRWLWFSWLTLSLVLAGWLLLFNLPEETTQPWTEAPVTGSVFTTLNEWRELPTIGRFGQILEADTGTGLVRVLIWEGVIELLQPHEPLQYPDGSRDIFNFLRPIIGYGPESMYVAYNRFYPPELANIEARNASPDRSHNETFDALVITGLAGFLTWQALYISFFYVGFRWLGVLRSRRDSYLMVGLWFGGGILVAILFSLWRGAIYLGVAYPFGTIIGMMMYLIYYALFARPPDEEIRPFAGDRLLVTGLVTAVLAHYVEVHFGIAIAATRVYFFMYVALLFAVTYLLPKLASEPAGGGKKWQPPAFGSVWGSVLLYTLMIGLMIAIIGYSFTTFNQQPGVVIESLSDITAGDIFWQSFFLDASENFREAPFVFVMGVLTWGLGILIAVSEMLKDGEMSIPAGMRALAARRRQSASVLLLVFGLLGFGTASFQFFSRMTGRSTLADMTPTSLLHETLMWVFGAVFIWAGALLLIDKTDKYRLAAGSVAVAGLVFALPVFVAGGLLSGVVTAVVCAIVLYLVWDKSWNSSLRPIVVMGIVSFVIGVFYAYFQAAQLRRALLYRFTAAAPNTIAELRDFVVTEAAQTANLLVIFFLFVFLVMIAMAFAIALNRKGDVRKSGSTAAYGVLLLLVFGAGAFVYTSNMRVIQADMVYKRGRFYDGEASASQNLENWDSAIAIYQDAIRRAPTEDFYYLFLGRAYLERSTLEQDTAAQGDLLDEAEARLQLAQAINPLNTDHTANLARLSTRWVGLSENEAVRNDRAEAAESYYRSALALSPQNSVIRNEYARLIYSVLNDCERAIEVYEESLEIDPYFVDTYYGLAELYMRCAANAEEADAEVMLDKARETLDTAVAERPDNPAVLVSVGQLYTRIGLFADAVAVYERAKEADPTGQVVTSWNLDFLLAQAHAQLGNTQLARNFAESALLTAPEQYTAQIQQLLDQINQTP